jgi:hypothetical protein
MDVSIITKESLILIDFRLIQIYESLFFSYRYYYDFFYDLLLLTIHQYLTEYFLILLTTSCLIFIFIFNYLSQIKALVEDTI